MLFLHVKNAKNTDFLFSKVGRYVIGMMLTWFCFLFRMIFLLQTRLPVYLSHDPAGTSVMDVVHYAQVSLEVECHLVYTHVWDMFCCKKQYLTFCQFEAFASGLPKKKKKWIKTNWWYNEWGIIQKVLFCIIRC